MLELMVGVAVAAILLTIGIPSFTSSIKQNQGATDANAMLTLLTVTRSEAIKRAQSVTVCVSGDGASCDTATDANWAEGYWMYFVPAGSTAATTLQGEVPLSKGSAIAATATFAHSISFNGLGTAGSVDDSNHFTAGTGTFTVTPNNLPSTQRKYIRCVAVYQSGRIYIKNPNATSFSCS